MIILLAQRIRESTSKWCNLIIIPGSFKLFSNKNNKAMMNDISRILKFVPLYLPIHFDHLYLHIFVFEINFSLETNKML